MALGTINVGTGSIGTRFIDKDYPVEEGLSGGITITGVDPSLEEC